MPNLQIEIRHLYKKYKNVEIIKNIDIRFQAGTVYGIVGRNGSGKSVFFKMILGFIKPTNGLIKFMCDKEEFQPRIAAVIDGSDLHPELSAMENLIYLSKFKKLIGLDEIKAALKRVGLDPSNSLPIKKYSIGMKKRLVIAQAIMEPIDILVMDEPTNGLDDSGVQMLYNVVTDIKRQGGIVLVSSHSREDITSMCDYVYRMKEGILWRESLN